MKPLAIVALSVCGAVIALVLILGFASLTVPGRYAGILDCGSVLAKADPLTALGDCDAAYNVRTTLMLAIGVPGLILGLGMFFAGRSEAATPEE
jgi:hypothetical protein